MSLKTQAFIAILLYSMPTNNKPKPKPKGEK